MLRWLTAGTAIATIAAAFALTWIKHDTRRLEARLQAQERQVEKAESDIAVLRAELGFLTRPERLEPLARTLLGLQPASSAQFITLDEIPHQQGPAPGPAAASGQPSRPGSLR